MLLFAARGGGVPCGWGIRGTGLGPGLGLADRGGVRDDGGPIPGLLSRGWPSEAPWKELGGGTGWKEPAGGTGWKELAKGTGWRGLAKGTGWKELAGGGG